MKRKRAKLKLVLLQQQDKLEEIQEQIKERCAKDFIFWANNFGWAHDEHAPHKERIKPLCLWDFQEDIALEIIENIWRCAGSHMEEWNCYGDKARKVAWTFLNLLIIQWFWQFHGISTVITSKTLDDVDTKGDMNTPFEKLRFQIEVQYKQFPWLFPSNFSIHDKENYKTCLIAIPNGGAQIAGLRPDGKAMRQARALIWFGDEFPHVDGDVPLWDAACGTVKVRILGGTPNKERGKNCKAYRLRFNLDNENARVFNIPWWKHPENAKGLYRKPDGTLSSPWYESMCKQKSKQTMATEYLMDWMVAMGGQVFYALREEESCQLGMLPDPYGGPIIFAWDPGLTFAIVTGQKDRYGRLRLLDEIVLTKNEIGEGQVLLNVMAEKAVALMNKKYRSFEVIHVGDPYGSRQQISAQVKNETEFDLLRKNYGIRVQSAFLYAIRSDERKTSRIATLLDLMGSDVEEPSGHITPKLLFDRFSLKTLYEAFKSGYRWKTDDFGENTDELIEEHPFEDVVDCAGMIALKLYGKDRGDNNSGGPKPKKPKKSGWRRSGQGYRKVG
ncbi:MAG: hypothetical protein K2W95_00850 [Candidatus Obscuribacterales bacterium]|nr:hypothetical protein [Candidatus Obscuribacterales bacterium]